MTLAPILLFVYNRPEHVRRSIESLLRNELAAQSELFIYADVAKWQMGIPFRIRTFAETPRLL